MDPLQTQTNNNNNSSATELKKRGRKIKYTPLTLVNDYPVEPITNYDPKDYVKDVLGRKWRIHPKTNQWVLQKVIGPRSSTSSDNDKSNSIVSETSVTNDNNNTNNNGSTSPNSSSSSKAKNPKKRTFSEKASMDSSVQPGSSGSTNNAATTAAASGPSGPGAGRPKMETHVATRDSVDISRCKIGAITTTMDENGQFWIVKKNDETDEKFWQVLAPNKALKLVCARSGLQNSNNSNSNAANEPSQCSSGAFNGSKGFDIPSTMHSNIMA